MKRLTASWNCWQRTKLRSFLEAKMKTQPHIAFLGLGIMGIAMARRLLDAGFPLTVFNRSPDKARDLAAKGAQVAPTAREAAAAADIVIGMVTDDDASRHLWLGEKGALSG